MALYANARSGAIDLKSDFLESASFNDIQFLCNEPLILVQ